MEQDTVINKLHLEGELLRTPTLINKYLKWHYEYKCAIGKGDTRMNQLIVEKARFYTGKGTSEEYRRMPFNDTISNQKDLERYISADKDICELAERILIHKAGCDMIQEFLETLKYRNNYLRTVLELRMFEAGS